MWFWVIHEPGRFHGDSDSDPVFFLCFTDMFFFERWTRIGLWLLDLPTSMFPRIASRNPMESLNPENQPKQRCTWAPTGGRRKKSFSKRITRVGGSNIFYVHPYLGKIPILTNIFQRDFNHQLDHHLKQPTSGFWCFLLFPYIQSPWKTPWRMIPFSS